MSVDELRSSISVVPPGDEAYAAIRHAILHGALQPGQRIVEQQLAESLSISRTPVREALLKLERENLVARMGRGMAVRTYSADEVRDIYDLRAQIEGYAARRACDRIAEAEITALERIQDELEAALDRSDAQEADSTHSLADLNQRFHGVVVRSVRSAPLERCFVGVLQVPLLYKTYLWYDEPGRRSSAAEHRRLVELLRGRDGRRAERLWRRHIERGRDVLVQGLTAHEIDRQ